MLFQNVLLSKLSGCQEPGFEQSVKRANPQEEHDMAKQPKQLDELFHEGLKDIYFAEKKILVALPKMAKAAKLDQAKAAFEKHRAETEKQVERLEQIFALIAKEPRGKERPAL